MAKPKSNFQPETETLKPLDNLIAEFAIVDAAVVDTAIEAYRDYPPDEELVNLLDAED